MAVTEYGARATTEPRPAPHDSSERLVFFIHGRFGHASLWDGLALELGSRVRSFAVHLPGFGRSFMVAGRAPDLVGASRLMSSVLRHFARPVDEVVLIGHDVGGVIAQLCALRPGADVQALVLVSSASLLESLTGFTSGWLGVKARFGLERALHERSLLDDQERGRILAPWITRQARRDLLGAIRTWERAWPRPPQHRQLAGVLRGFRSPVLLLWGSRDEINPPDLAIEMMRHLPDATFFEHLEAGHWPSLEATGWVGAKLRDFLFRIDSASQDRARLARARSA